MSTAELDVPLGPELAGTLMTPDEFDAVEEWDEKYVYELIRGVLVVSPSPLAMERGPNGVLEHWLGKYQEEHPQGAALDATLSEHTIHTPDSRRRADRAIWTGLGRLPHPNRDVPSIVVELSRPPSATAGATTTRNAASTQPPESPNTGSSTASAAR
jgi:hypothetical protein